MPYLGQQRILLPGVQSSDLTSGKIKSGRGKDALATGGYDAIATIVAPSGGLANAIFTGIPQEYKHIQIRGISRRSTNDTYNGQSVLRINADTAANFSIHTLYGNGGGGVNTLAYADATAISTYATPGAGQSTFNGFILDIFDYANTSKYKTVRWALGWNQNGGAADTQITSGNWRSFAPITQINLYPADGVWTEYSHFALYGVR